MSANSPAPHTGAIGLLTDALQYQSLRIVVLRSLAVMTSHGGMRERVAVADKTLTKLVNIAGETTTDDPVFMYCVSILCHTCEETEILAEASD